MKQNILSYSQFIGNGQAKLGQHYLSEQVQVGPKSPCYPVLMHLHEPLKVFKVVKVVKLFKATVRVFKILKVLKILLRYSRYSTNFNK